MNPADRSRLAIPPVHDPFGRSNLPAGFTVSDRVRMLIEVRDCLLAGRAPPPGSATFVGSAIQAWLDSGAQAGLLDRKFLRLAAPRGSHRTASRIAREIDSDG
jgi:hypothetical protein